MTDCRGCGHELGEGRFCTQCGLPAARPEPAMSARTAGPRTPPPAPSKRPTRYPLYAEQPPAPTEPPPSDRLSETAIAPMGLPVEATRAPEPEPRGGLGITERVERMVASGDPTWVMSFGVLAGVLVAVFVLGLLLVLI